MWLQVSAMYTYVAKLYATQTNAITNNAAGVCLYLTHIVSAPVIAVPSISLFLVIAIRKRMPKLAGNVHVKHEAEEPRLKAILDCTVENLALCFLAERFAQETTAGSCANMRVGSKLIGSILSLYVIQFIEFHVTANDRAIIIDNLSKLIRLANQGATWPAIQPMTARWIPPMERSKFVSHMMASSLGAAITMLMCGFLIASLGWESVFYVTGVIGIIWSVTWFLLVFDSPSQHPRISAEERHFIESAIGTTTTTKHLPVPWRSLVTSRPVWAIVITHSCSVFGYHTIVNQLPTYMKYILHFNIKENGLLSSLPYLGKYIFALSMSILADYLRRNNKLSVTAIRKIFTTFAVLTPSILMVIQANYGCDRAASVAVFTVALTINGGITAGYLGNGLDIAPNFSGTIFGIANTFSSIGGFLSSFMVGNITYHNQTYTQWTIIFWILAAIYLMGAIAFAVLGTGELQSWNNPPDSRAKENGVSVEDGAESVPLKSKTIS
ncbi:PREDICTED: putative inorganic phosphate cotransporter [Vollenhovia emeryi]|uniref:putative inorganic phosphate cotransporter n=1 Tax=Vollenhovia emeryi TaxID=411798 RepID=UPI0005F39C35|nr:PREDICTED: putative inorganic phosphate cotransporter [Vollenhovia emeryi]